MDASHGLHQLLLAALRAGDIEAGQEVLGHSNKGIPRPAAEPIHSATRDQARELQGTVAELFSNLRVGNTDFGSEYVKERTCTDCKPSVVSAVLTQPSNFKLSTAMGSNFKLFAAMGLTIGILCGSTALKVRWLFQ